MADISPKSRLHPLFAAAVCLLLSACRPILATRTAAGVRPQTMSGPAGFASLAPSNTELIYSLQAQDKLAAVCSQCDYPAAVKSKPQLGSFLSIDAERLAQLHPDRVFLVNEQSALAHSIKRQNIETIILPNAKVSDIAANLRTIGGYCHKQRQAEQLAQAFTTAVQNIKTKASATKKRPKVFFCVWPEPLIAVGRASYLNDAITICGGENLSGQLNQAYPNFNSELLLLNQPDIIILPDEASHDKSFTKRPPWSLLSAVKNNKVFYLPPRDQDRLSRPTLRLVTGLTWLAQRLHPEITP